MPTMLLEHKMESQDEFELVESWYLNTASPQIDMASDLAGVLMRGEIGVQHGDTLRVRLVAKCPTCLELRNHDDMEHYDPERKDNPDAICIPCWHKANINSGVMPLLNTPEPAQSKPVHIQDPTTSENRGLCGDLVNRLMSGKVKRSLITCATCRSIQNRTERIEEVHCMQHRDVAGYMHEVGNRFE